MVIYFFNKSFWIIWNRCPDFVQQKFRYNYSLFKNSDLKKNQLRPCDNFPISDSFEPNIRMKFSGKFSLSIVFDVVHQAVSAWHFSDFDMQNTFYINYIYFILGFTNII